MTISELQQFEKEIACLFELGKIKCPIHLSSGNEEQLITIFKDIAPWDYIFSTHRNHYHYLLHTNDRQGLIEKILVNYDSMHTCNPKYNFYSSSIVGGCVAIACGVALSLKLKNSVQKVWCFIGDGATDEGWFTEAVKYAITRDLPIVYVIEDNNRSVESTIIKRWGIDASFKNNPGFNGKLLVYQYECGYPHAGVGKFIDLDTIS